MHAASQRHPTHPTPALLVLVLVLASRMNAQVWSARDFSLLRTLAGHEGKVMGADVSPRGDHVFATVAYDRTVKFWAPE